MVRRHNNQLPDNLPQLQNLIKRDPASYKEEFEQQYRHYTNTLEVFLLNPSTHNKSLDELVNFMSQVAHCYPDQLGGFPQQLTGLLQTHGPALDPSTRLALCRALVLLRNRGLLAPTDLLQLFFRLLACRDRALCSFLRSHIISDISNVNARRKDARLNSALQNFMYGMLRDGDKRAAKTSIDIMTELYKKNVWNDAKTVNVIASGCFSQHVKVMIAALRFFQGSDDPDGEGEADSDSDDEPTIKEVSMANRVNKKSRKRERQLEKVKRLVVKGSKKRAQASAYNFSALQLVHDPQDLAERLLALLDARSRRHEVRMFILDVVSRLIGLHELQLLAFYPHVQRLLRPQQRDVTRALQYAAQAAHTLVPPDALEPLVRAIVNNFVSERNSADAMAIGLNAVRELCARCPLAMDEDLLQDLVQFRTHRERAVSMAARSLLQLFRRERPVLLRRRDRGRPTEASVAAVNADLQFGRMDVPDHVVGADVLVRDTQAHSVDVSSGSESDSDDDQWIDMEQDPDTSVTEPSEQPVADVTELAKKVVLEKLLTDEDFKRIEVENASRQVRGVKRKHNDPVKDTGGGLVRLADIENVHKKRRHDKEARLESVRRGQQEREPYGRRDGRANEYCSKTNREKRKNKNFLMLRHKAGRKVKRSFKDKQIALRNHLLKQKRMK